MAETLCGLWMGKKSNINHLHIWDCIVEARPCRPHKKKLDSITVRAIYWYPKRSRGYKFYDLTSKSFFETKIIKFFQDVEFGGRQEIYDFVIEDKSIYLHQIGIDSNQA